LEIGNNKEQVNKIFEFIEFGENSSSEEFFWTFWQNDNNLLKEWLKELNFVYNGLLNLWISKKFIRINPSISRWLNYYTGTVFETFIVWSENLWSISSGWRYENLASNFTKNSYPWVWWSIWLTRLIAVLKSLWKIFVNRETISKVLVLNMWESTLKINLKIIENLRKSWINAEFYLEDVKIQKQLKYANIKKIPFAIICGENEQKRNVVQLKNLDTWEQKEVKEEEIVNLVSNLSM
jgi:histidyl-tRNA synthetase